MDVNVNAKTKTTKKKKPVKKAKITNNDNEANNEFNGNIDTKLVDINEYKQDDIIDNTNNYNNFNDFEEQYVPEPIQTYTDKLIGDFETEFDDFETFKQNIISDNSIDESMKKIIIESRKDFIDKFENKVLKSAEKTMRIGITSLLIVKIKSQNNLVFNNEFKKKILEDIDKWIDGTITIIALESDQLYQLQEIIKKIEKEKKITGIEKLKNIFVPHNYSEYLDFVDFMEIIKKEEQEKINKELEEIKLLEQEEIRKKEIEEKNNNEIKLRESKLSILHLNLNKIGCFDKETLILKEKLFQPIKKFIDLETNTIILDNGLYGNLLKFLNSIRIKKEDKEEIINLCENI